MKKIDFPALLLAILVVLMFVGVGFAIALRNLWLVFLFIVLGFSIMGSGLAIKRRKSDSHA